MLSGERKSVFPSTDDSFKSRIPWGATQANEYLLKLIQLKYPTFPTRVTTGHTGVRLLLVI